MKADGCPRGAKKCKYPKDVYADITPLDYFRVSTFSAEFIYLIEWDRHYRNAPATIRKRMICDQCLDSVLIYWEELAKESSAIDAYYERSDRESSKRKRHAQHPASG